MPIHLQELLCHNPLPDEAPMEREIFTRSDR